MYTEVTPFGTVGGSVSKTARVPVPFETLEEDDAWPEVAEEDVIGILCCADVLDDNEDVVEVLLLSKPGTSAIAPISTTTITTARTIAVVLPAILVHLNACFWAIGIRNCILERYVLGMLAMFKLLNTAFFRTFNLEAMHRRE